MGGREDGGGISAAVEEKEGPRAKPCNATVDVGQGVAALPGIRPPSAGAGTEEAVERRAVGEAGWKLHGGTEPDRE